MIKLWPFKPNDWKAIHSERYEFTVSNYFNGTKIDGTSEKRATLYILSYSKSRDKYRITWEGYNPLCEIESLLEYKKCLEKQIELQKS